MYFKYLQEREPEVSVLQREYGFALYKEMTIKGERAIYIQDIYVDPDHRESNLATEMSQDIQKIAKKDGIAYILGSVVPSAKNSHKSLLVLIAHGMQLIESNDDIIWFCKEI